MASSSGPSSPGPPVRLPDCIEELVRFTLASAVEGTLGADLRLSRHYCAGLLQEDGPLDDPRLALLQGEVSDDCDGVPVYPLYKRLARAIQRCIDHGSFLRTSKFIKGIPEDESLKGKEKEWNELIADQGSELLNHVKKYPSFLEMLKAESLTKVLPGVKTIEEGVQVYRNFYTEEKEKKSGVLAISVSRSDSQPYVSLGALLSGLGYEGVSCLLGLVHTVGSIPDALPPARSVLLSSFMVLHSSKNQLALEVINRLLTCSCWMNIHAIQPYDYCFEIRVDEGYGARWSRDGSKDFWSHTWRKGIPGDGSIRNFGLFHLFMSHLSRFQESMALIHVRGVEHVDVLL
ncbi:hypothetical protein Taro_019490, partial [Colocasia esculenta]|nr:hypothetical protein [Colocasia esculenta]